MAGAEKQNAATGAALRKHKRETQECTAADQTSSKKIVRVRGVITRAAFPGSARLFVMTSWKYSPAGMHAGRHARPAGAAHPACSRTSAARCG